MKNTRLATTQSNAIALLAVILGGAPILHAANGLVPGDERRWALDFRTRLEQQGSPRPVEIRLGGDWTWTVSAVRPAEYDVALQLVNVRINGSASSESNHQTGQLQRRLAQIF